MDARELSRVEKLCEQLYSDSQVSQLERMEAHRALMVLQTSSQYLPQCQHILSNSSSDYALLFAARSILVIVSKDWRNISSDDRIALGTFLLKRVQGSDPNHFIPRSIINVLCRVTRLGWVSNKATRSIIDDVVKMLQEGPQNILLGLRIIGELVSEFDQAQGSSSGLGFASGRMAAQAFREQGGLTQCFKIALDSVQMSANTGNTNRTLLKESLRTLLLCIDYDFVGTTHDDGEDGTSCLYLPAEWAEHIAVPQALKQFFEIYHAQWKIQNESEIDADDNGPSSLCLQILALLTAVRRSVFEQESRKQFLAELLSGTTQLMINRPGLQHNEACLHHLCRLLSQIKSHFQLQELANSPQYPQWLQTVTSFTQDAYNAWRSISSRSVFYLSSLWSSMVLPIPYLRLREVYVTDKRKIPAGAIANGNQQGDQQSAESGLNQAVPQVLAAYIQSRCDMCALAAVSALDDESASNAYSDTAGYSGFGQGFGGIEEDPLDDEGMLLEELASFPVLTRFNFPSAAALIAQIYNDALVKRKQAFSAISQQNVQNVNAVRLALTDAQARLAFLTYFIGAVVGGNISRVAANCIENLDGLNAELASLVFRMVVETQQAEDAMTNQGKQAAHIVFGMGSDSGLKLELASLYFFRCFQNLYIESRAREDLEVVENRRQRAFGLVEDPNGFLTFTWNRGSGGETANRAGGVSDSAHSSSVGIILGGRGRAMNRDIGGGRRRNSMDSSLARNSSLPRVMPSLQSLGIISETKVSTNEEAKTNDASMSEVSKEDKEMNDDITQRASNVQQGISGRLGIQGGDRVLLDIAMRRIFGLLQHAHSAGGSGEGENANKNSFAATANLIERALGVLYQLSIGVTIVHAGVRYSPRLMYSGRLLLESEVIQALLKNPSAERFPMLLDPRHGRARTFLMATLSKLLFTQTRFPNAAAETNQETSSALTTVDPNAPKVSAEERVYSLFTNFLQPMANTADSLLSLVTGGLSPAQMLSNINQTPNIDPAKFRRQDIAVSLIGLCRDLRGICFSATTPKDYELILSWICPTRMPVLVAGASAWYDNTDVVGPLLKLIAELIYSRRNRIVIPQNSAGGLILSREVCRVVIAYISPHLQDRERKRQETANSATGESVNGTGMGNDPMSMAALREAIMSMGGQDGKDTKKNGVITLGDGCVGPGITVDFSPAKMKCARSCVQILTRMLNARLVNVGIMDLYGDTSLVDTTRAILEFAFMGSPTHVMGFTKMSRAVIVMLSKLAEQHVLLLVDIKEDLFARMMACLGEALNSPDTAFSTPAARVIESIAVFRCKAAAHASAPASQLLIESNNIIFSGSKVGPSQIDMQKAVQAFAKHEAAQPQLFGEFLSLCLDRLFTTVPGQDAPNTWSLARPVLPLVLCSAQNFEQYRNNFLSALSLKRQTAIRAEFDQLFVKLSPAITRGNEGIVSNPSRFKEVLRTNDLFTKELCTFARQMKNDI